MCCLTFAPGLEWSRLCILLPFSHQPLAFEIVLQIIHQVFWNEACPSLISFCVLCREEDGTILEVYMLELNLDKLAYSTAKLEHELQYELVP